MTRKVLILALLLIPFTAGAESLDATARQGVAHYNHEEFEQASNKFLEAQAQKPDHPEVAYNLGNSDYRLEKYESALESYAKALAESTDSALRQKSLYNSGNAWYQLGDLDKAIEYYSKALELDPSDVDSKFNLEFTRKRLTRAKESGQIAPRDKTRQDQNQQNGNNPGDDTQAPEEDRDEKDGEPGSSQNKNSSPDKEAPPQGAETPEDSKMADVLHQMAPMTQEEAERWLTSLDEDLKKFMRKQLQGQMKDVFVDPEKDW